MANSFAYILWACFSPFLIFSAASCKALGNEEPVLHKLFKIMIPRFKFQVKDGPGQVSRRMGTERVYSADRIF